MDFLVLFLHSAAFSSDSVFKEPWYRPHAYKQLYTFWWRHKIWLVWLIPGSKLVQSKKHSGQRGHHSSQLRPEKGRSEVRREAQSDAVSTTALAEMHSAHLHTSVLVKFKKYENNIVPLDASVPYKLNHMVDFKQWKFYLLQSWAFHCVCCYLCKCQRGRNTLCVLHLSGLSDSLKLQQIRKEATTDDTMQIEGDGKDEPIQLSKQWNAPIVETCYKPSIEEKKTNFLLKLRTLCCPSKFKLKLVSKLYWSWFRLHYCVFLQCL